MKITGVILIIIGLAGSVFVYGYDLIVKHEAEIKLGPRSGPALGLCVLLLIVGIFLTTVTASRKKQE